MLRDLSQAQASEVEAHKKIVDIEAHAQEKIRMFKFVKYEQG